MGNTLLMPFIDKSESFTLGFECGQIWTKISEGETLNRYLCHTKNRCQIAAILETFGLDWFFDDADDEWTYLTTSSVIKNVNL